MDYGTAKLSGAIASIPELRPDEGAHSETHLLLSSNGLSIFPEGANRTMPSFATR